MKKILVLLVLMVSFTVSAQRTITDTIQGSETVTFETMADAVQIQVLCTELGGTSDGEFILKGSVDGVSFGTLFEKVSHVNFFPNDTLTVADGAVWLISIKDKPFNYYQLAGTGTSADTTLITVNWSK